MAAYEDLGAPGWDQADATALAKKYKIDLSRTGGVARDGVLDAAIAANPQLRAEAAARQAAINPNRSQSPATYTPGGVTPITMEPRHRFEKEALTSIGTGDIERPNVRAEQYMDRFGESQADATELLGSSASGFNQAEFDQYFNPYTEQVTDRSVSRLSDQAKAMKAQLSRQMASNRGNATFGDLYGAQAMGDIDEELLKSSGDIRATGNQNAFTTALEALFRQRGLQGNAGQAMGNTAGRYMQGAGVATDIAGANLNQGLTRLNAQYGAGSNIRDFNQNWSDLSFENQMAPQRYGNAATTTALQQFPNAQGAVSQYTAAPIDRFGQVARAGGEIVDSMRGIKF